MVDYDRVRDWLENHGYHDLYPIRDAADPTVYFYTYVREGRRRINFPVVAGRVDPDDFEHIQREVMSYGKDVH